MEDDEDGDLSNLPFDLSESVSALTAAATGGGSSSPTHGAQSPAAVAAASGPEARRGEAVVAVLGTLHVLCKSEPSLLAPHVDTLLPYLKADNRVGGHLRETRVCALVANIAALALPLVPPNARDAATLVRAAEDLKRLTYKFGSEVVAASVECLAVLADISPAGTTKNGRKVPSAVAASNAEKPLLDLAKVFYRQLRQRVRHTGPLEGKDLSVVQRALVVLGAVCRFRRGGTADNRDGLDLLEARDADEDGDTSAVPRSSSAGVSQAKLLPDELCEANMRGACYYIFLTYLKMKPAAVATSALKGLGGQLIGAPRLMLAADRDGVVASALSHPSSLLRLEALLSWKQILEAEEHRVESGVARREMESRLDLVDSSSSGVSSGDEEDEDDEDDDAFEEGEKVAGGSKKSGTVRFDGESSGGGRKKATKRKVQGDQDSESSVVGGVLQMHVRAVLGLLFDPSRQGPQIRSAATFLLGVMLRQGLVNPLEVMPSLVALLGAPDAELRAEALRLVLLEDEKHPDFLRSRLNEGVCRAYSLQLHLIGEAAPVITLANAGAADEDRACSTQEASIFGQIYTLCLRSQRPKRAAVLRGLLGLFDQKRSSEVEAWTKAPMDRSR